MRTRPSPGQFLCRYGELRLSRVLTTAVVLVALATLLACASVPPSAENRTFESVYQDALNALNAGKTSDAEIFLKQAVQKNPRHPYPHFYLGVLYSDRGQDDLAIVAFRRAVDLQPYLHEALYNLGTIALRRGEYARAIELLEQCLEINPDNVEAYNNLGKAYFMAGAPELAGAAFEEALARDPESEVALENLVMLLEAAGDHENAATFRSRLHGGP